MALPPDYHMHTPLCRHATGEPTDYAARALELGLSEIGFSDHSPMARDDFDDWRMMADQLDLYVENVRKARRDHPTLTIKLALEVDYLPGHEDWIRDLAGRHPWDYFIGSVHYLGEDWAIDNPHQIDQWQRRDPDEVWSAYFDCLTRAVETGLFEIIGHADLCKKFGCYPKQNVAPHYKRLLQAAHKNQTAIEINTAGLRKPCAEMYPAPPLLQLARQSGVPLTFGSDAHARNEVGLNFPEAVQFARKAGYTHYCRFTHRKPEPVAL